MFDVYEYGRLAAVMLWQAGVDLAADADVQALLLHGYRSYIFQPP